MCSLAVRHTSGYGALLVMSELKLLLTACCMFVFLPGAVAVHWDVFLMFLLAH